jgi:hypothetical protein
VGEASACLLDGGPSRPIPLSLPAPPLAPGPGCGGRGDGLPQMARRSEESRCGARVALRSAKTRFRERWQSACSNGLMAPDPSIRLSRLDHGSDRPAGHRGRCLVRQSSRPAEKEWRTPGDEVLDSANWLANPEAAHRTPRKSRHSATHYYGARPSDNGLTGSGRAPWRGARLASSFSRDAPSISSYSATTL